MCVCFVWGWWRRNEQWVSVCVCVCVCVCCGYINERRAAGQCLSSRRVSDRVTWLTADRWPRYWHSLTHWPSTTATSVTVSSSSSSSRTAAWSPKHDRYSPPTDGITDKFTTDRIYSSPSSAAAAYAMQVSRLRDVTPRSPSQCKRFSVLHA